MKNSTAHPSSQVLALAGGLLSADLLLNLPRFSAPLWAGSLLAPSIDLLVISAILLLGAQSGKAARRATRVMAAVAIALFDTYALLSRFGTPASLLLAAVPGAAAMAAAGWLAAGLAVRGFETGVMRNAFLVLVALAAILQVVLAGRILTPSVVPSMVGDLVSLFRWGRAG